MKVKGILPFARQLLQEAVTDGSICIDGTAGNGHDTLFLANLVGENGHVFGFDIQKEAIEATANRLDEHGCRSRATLFCDSHEHVKSHIPEIHHGKITGAIFNLGYLPGGNKEIVTKPETTIMAIREIFSLMAKEGMIVLVIYHGHPEGEKEKEELLSYVTQLDQQEAHVLTYQFINQKNNPPFIVAIEKRK